VCRRRPQETEALTTAARSRAARRPPQPVPVPQEDERIKAIVKSLLACLDDAKAEDVTPINLAGKTSIADAMIVATGRSTTHVGAIADRVIRACKDAGLDTPRVEGIPACDWVLVDAGDVLVHIFRPEVREFYNLEKLWGGNRPVEPAGGGLAH